MKLPSVSHYVKIFFSEIKVPDMISIKLFNSRLDSACSHLAALLFKLQACSMMDLNKVACTSKLCAWKKSRTQANPAPFLAINFRRPKNNDLVASASNDEVNIKSHCSRDPKRLPELVRNKFIQLKEIAPKAAVLSSVSIFADTQLDSGTDTADEDETTCIPEPLGSLFESRTINFNARDLESYLKKVFLQYEKSYIQKHFDNLCKITRDQSLSRSWKAHRVGRITSSFAKTAFSANQCSLSKSFIANIMQCSPPFRSEATDYGKNMENIPENYFKHFLGNFIEIAKLKKPVFM